MTLEELQSIIKKLLAYHRFDKVFDLMDQYLTDEQKTEIGLTGLKGENYRKKRRENKGEITDEEIGIYYNKLISRIEKTLQFLKEIDPTEERDEREIQEFIIVIISSERKKELERLLDKLRFKKLAFAEKVDLASAKNAALIIFDNMDLPNSRNLSNEEKAIIAEREKVMQSCLDQTDNYIIHYGNYLALLNANRDRIQGANSQFALYARVKEVLNFIKAYSS